MTEISFAIPTKKRGFKQIFQFHISLVGIDPPIWRRIQVPDSYTFYDLHVAIQDAMGWEDSHLHLFEVGKGIEIDCPFAEPMLGEEIQLWTCEVPLARYFKRAGRVIAYRYDFGDNWLHRIKLEAILPRASRIAYPRSMAGERACPPEDCGGPYGHARCLAALKNPDTEDEFSVWLGDWRPEDFDANKVRFAEPRERFLRSFDE